MSIQPTIVQEHQNIDPNHSVDSQSIRQDIIAIISDPRLKGKIIIPLINLKQIKIYFLTLNETLYIKFSDDYPNQGPALRLENSELNLLILHDQKIQNWDNSTQLADLVYQIYEDIKEYWDSHEIIKKEYQKSIQKRKQNSEENFVSKKKVQMNGCTDTELTETKNLNRHFRSKLREIYTDLIKALPPDEIPEDAKWIDDSFGLPRVGFEDIARILKNQWFNKQVCRQMQNGKFMHKIMKGMMSIKSKKLMVKYYHVMLAAAKQPSNFIKWKYT